MGGSSSKDTASADCPVVGQGEASNCPVPESQRSAAVYNVYNQRIDSGSTASTSSPSSDMDPRNNMPREANQQPCAGQRQLISTARLVSNIPKGGTQGTWVYPSPQMFYNGQLLHNEFVTFPTVSCWASLTAKDLQTCSTQAERQRQRCGRS